MKFTAHVHHPGEESGRHSSEGSPSADVVVFTGAPPTPGVVLPDLPMEHPEHCAASPSFPAPSSKEGEEKEVAHVNIPIRDLRTIFLGVLKKDWWGIVTPSIDKGQN